MSYSPVHTRATPVTMYVMRITCVRHVYVIRVSYACHIRHMYTNMRARRTCDARTTRARDACMTHAYNTRPSHHNATIGLQRDERTASGYGRNGRAGGREAHMRDAMRRDATRCDAMRCGIGEMFKARLARRVAVRGPHRPRRASKRTLGAKNGKREWHGMARNAAGNRWTSSPEWRGTRKRARLCVPVFRCPVRPLLLDSHLPRG